MDDVLLRFLSDQFNPYVSTKPRRCRVSCSQATKQGQDQDAKLKDLEAKLKASQTSDREARAALKAKVDELKAEKASLNDLKVGWGQCCVSGHHMQAILYCFCTQGRLAHGDSAAKALASELDALKANSVSISWHSQQEAQKINPMGPSLWRQQPWIAALEAERTRLEGEKAGLEGEQANLDAEKAKLERERAELQASKDGLDKVRSFIIDFSWMCTEGCGDCKPGKDTQKASISCTAEPSTTQLLLPIEASELQQARSGISMLEGQKAELEGSKAKLEGRLAQLEGSKADLEGRLAQLQTALDSAQAQNSKSEEEVQQLKAQ
eukprot:1137107-Pelagomonas_calceolata.AAC.1